MKKIGILVTLVMALGIIVIGGPFIGAEIVPSDGYGVTYLAVGWDSGSWIKTTFSMSNPFYVDSWYGVSVTPLWSLTPSFRIGGGLNLWTELCNWQFNQLTWSASAEVVGKWRGIMGWLKFNIPLEVPSNVPFFGAWITVGIAYDFFPCCISEVPECPELGSGCK